MSDPKPLRFAHVDEQVRNPSWLPADQQAGGGPAPMQPPEVQVGTISGAEYKPGIGHVPAGVSRGEVANANGSGHPGAPDPVVSQEEVQALLQELEATRGHLQAHQAEVQRLTDELAMVRNEFVRGTLDLATARSETLASVEAQLLELSVEIAGSILNEEIAERPDLHQRLVEAGLEHLRGESRVVLRCSPTAYDAVVETLGGGHVELKGTQIDVVVDGNLKGAGCVLESQTRRVDARLSERLAAVRESLLAENRRRREVGS